MDLNTLLEMVVGGDPGRVAISAAGQHITTSELRAAALRGGARVWSADVVVYLGGNGMGFPVALFSAAAAGRPFVPVNYRMGDTQLSDVLARWPSAFVVTDDVARIRSLGPAGLDVTATPDFLASVAAGPTPESASVGPDDVALLLMTSGTTSAPKSAVLRHVNLTSYLFGSVDFAGAAPGEAALVSVPPYHIAAVANLLSNLYTGRRIVYLDRFTAAEWLDTVELEQVSHAMVVPTMLARIVEELQRRGTTGPSSLLNLSYGGSKVAASVVEEALRLFPDTGFVNAYGLTETSSSVTVLDPISHREALASNDPVVRARLRSAGRALPDVDIEIRDAIGEPVPAGTEGEIVLRGAQVAGEYVEGGSRLDGSGWFATRDRGYLDEGGFLFVIGRADDTIIRGGENIAPAEIEEVLAQHPGVRECAVAGAPDEEWGQVIVAFVVPDPAVSVSAEALQEFVRARLRSSRTPDRWVFLDELVTTATGKVVRRVMIDQLANNSDV